MRSKYSNVTVLAYHHLIISGNIAMQLNETKDALSLAKVLMRSTMRYKVAHIHSRKDKLAYFKGIRHAINIANLPWNTVRLAEHNLESHLRYINRHSLEKRTLFCDTKVAYLTAISDALLILGSMRVRFVDGGRDTDARFIETIESRNKC
jgi:hypothetical protein